MKRLLASLCLLVTAAEGLPAASLSFTGILGSPEDVFEAGFTLASPDTVTFQTWGFGGGKNAAGQTITAGGFDPLIALYQGLGNSAAIAVDISLNPLADADNLSNPPWSYVGNCPPAGTTAIGSNNDCGDDLMQVSLAAGDYTLLLTDANYLPLSVFDNGILSEGFADLTAGTFQTCDSNACITTNGSFAVDIVTVQAVLTSVPEPGALSLLALGLAITVSWKYFRKEEHNDE